MKKGDIVKMTSAGGWGYDPRNNGCLALITSTGVRTIFHKGKDKLIPYIAGIVLNPIVTDNCSGWFDFVPRIKRESDPNIGEYTVEESTVAEIDSMLEESEGLVNEQLNDKQKKMLNLTIQKMLETEGSAYEEIEI